MTRPANSPRPLHCVAVVGAGMAGAALARALLDEGIEVHVFDKSRGPGGRLATRRVPWTDAQGQARLTGFDHGTPWFTAHDAAFRAAVERAVRCGVVTTWHPRAHPHSVSAGERDDAGTVFLPAPTMTRWCRLLVDEARQHWEWPVDVLRRSGGGWQLEGAEGVRAQVFDAVLLALPPAQAASLLAPHQPEWAQRARLLPMQPCWTVMAVTDVVPGLRAWDMARPETGALGLVVRNDNRPARDSRRDEVHWVLHAKAGWSRAHLEHEAAWVQQALQQALCEWLGTPLRWRHALAHRWRYAQPHASRHALRPSAWWDERLGLGLCGDALGGGAGGVEGAWRSAQALVRRMLQREVDDEPAASPPVAPPPGAAPDNTVSSSLTTQELS